MNARELIGSLTQARVQMTAAQAIINRHADELAMTPAEVTGLQTGAQEIENLRLDAQKLERCMGVVEDVRSRYERPNPPEVKEESGS